MSFIISDAHAQGAPVNSDPFGFLIPMIVIFVGFYFLLIRPQQKRQKAHAELVKSLSSGDEIMTSGGLLAKVVSVNEHYATIQLSKDVNIKIQKASVSSVVPKGTIEAA